MDHVTNITLAFPNWFYGITAIGLLGLVFYMGALHSKIRNLCDDHPKIQTSLIRISEILLQKKMTQDAIYVASASPVQLTAEGKQAIANAQFQSFYEQNKKELNKRVQDKKPANVPDLEEACKEVMLSIEDTLPGFDTIKKYAYGRGEPISVVLFACAIALRDILQRELNIQD